VRLRRNGKAHPPGYGDLETSSAPLGPMPLAILVEKGVARSTDVRFTGPFLVMTAAGAADLRTRTLDFRADPRLVASAGTPGEAPRGTRIYADTPNILANPETALRALRDALTPRH
jgi:hypothetical protein